MDFKNLNFTKQLLCALLVAAPLCEVQAQAPADPPAAPAEEPTGLDALFSDAEKAFAAKDYPTAIAKLEELLKAVAQNKNVPAATLEMLRFNIGLGYLLNNDGPKAEAAFTEALKQHPKGEYASRSYLGVGRACILQNTPEKKEKAIEALKQAAFDPKYRSEAGLSLGQVYNDLNRPEEAFAVFRSLMGSDVRTPQQTNAAVEVIGLLAKSEKLDDLTAYLDRVINQSGIREAIAWYSNQIIVLADELSGSGAHETALALYRSIPPRRQILETQRIALEAQKREIAVLEKRLADEAKLPVSRRSGATGENLANLKAALEMNTQALAAIDGKADLDAALLLRRGRSLYFLERYEEALVCFRVIRTQHPQAADLQAAAYSEIFVYNQLQNSDELQKRATDFLQKHPDSKNIEQVAVLAGEGLAKAGKWEEVLAFYKDLEAKFPNSETLDRFVFFQGVSLFRMGKFAEASQVFTKFVQTFPNSGLYEDAMYQVAMANFVEGKYKETLASCQEYLKRFPAGRYSGDIRYRLAYIDFRDAETDNSKKIIKDITTFVDANIDDPSTGMMLNLLGDTYTQKKEMQKEKDSQDKALDAYKRAINSESPDDVIRYATEQATVILQGKKDWTGLANLHMDIMKRRPGSSLALISSTWVAKMKVREGKGIEAAELLAETLKESIGDPANEQVESLLDELVRTLVPKRSKDPVDADALFAQLKSILEKAATGQESPTTNARIAYASARLADMLRLPDRADLFLKGMAANTDPAVLSPMLLSASGEILLKDGQLDQAQAMFQRIVDRYQESAFADAGPVGLARVAMARKDYQQALDLFNEAIETSPGMSRFQEATAGKLEALTMLGKLEDAEKLGLEILGDKQFKGQTAGKAYLVLGQVFRSKASTKSGSEKEEDLKKANGYYVNAFARFKSIPDIAAEGLLKSYETLTELGDSDGATETLKILKENAKLQNTPAAKKAQTL